MGKKKKTNSYINDFRNSKRSGKVKRELFIHSFSVSFFFLIPLQECLNLYTYMYTPMWKKIKILFLLGIILRV